MDTKGQSAARGAPSPLRWGAFFGLAGAVVAIDQALKESVRTAFDPGEGVHLFGTYSIHHVENTGVAGGGFQGSALPLAVLALLFVLLAYDFLARRGYARVPLLVGFGLLVGGGLGNLVDRARLGVVTDFIRNGQYAYNLADLAIFVGGFVVLVALVVSLVLARRQPVSSGT